MRSAAEDRHDRLKRIFAEAIDIGTEADRRAFVESHCLGDRELRGEVESLLRAHRGSHGFLDQPALAGGGWDAQSEVAAGSLIGRFRVCERIGEGGFGVVYRAEQESPVRREVALKVIKLGMDTRAVIARFDAERRALAMMEHPNIARVIDAGATESGRPYFVMELVRGVPITQFCDEHGHTIRQRLRLFIQVCLAVQHAHQKGIIHRDLKPNNVLVAVQDGRPQVKVIDFGVAKATEQDLTDGTVLTNARQFVGTPAYMSPEQAAMSVGGIDTRSDVYGLGVLLYELLTGSPPFDESVLRRAGYKEVCRTIEEVEPQRPSLRLGELGDRAGAVAAGRGVEIDRLVRTVRGDLDWIVMKCLEKDRARRYETANGLVRDIERYLGEEPVEASPPSRVYRISKFARRHRVAVVAGVLIAVSLITGLSLAMVGQVRAGWERDRALVAEGLAESRRIDAERSEANARAEARRTQQTLDLLINTLASTNAYTAGAGGYSLQGLLDDFADRLDGHLQDSPQIEADIRMQIALAYGGMGMPDRAEPHAARALALLRAVGSEPDQRMAECLTINAWAEYWQSDESRAESLAREALAIRRRLGMRYETVAALLDVQYFLNSQERFAEAEAVASEAERMTRGTGIEDAPLASDRLSHRALTVLGLGDEAGAESLARRALERSLESRGPRHIGTAWVHRVVARVLTAAGQREDARGSLEASLGIMRDKFGNGHWVVAQILRELGRLALDDGDLYRARELLNESLSVAVTLAARSPSNVPLRQNLSVVCDDMVFELYPRLDRWQEAVDVLAAAADQAPRSAALARALGVARYRAGDWAASAALIEGSLAQGEAGRETDHLILAMAHYRLGHVERADRWYGLAIAGRDQADESESVSALRGEAAALMAGTNQAREHAVNRQ